MADAARANAPQTYEDLTLPRVSVSVPPSLVDDIDAGNLSADDLARAIVYIARQIKKAEVLAPALDAAKAKLLATYRKRKPENRTSITTPRGQVVYTSPSKKTEITDEEALWQALTPAERKLCYKPDIKKLEQVLPAEKFKKFTRVTDGRADGLTIKPLGEIDPDE